MHTQITVSYKVQKDILERFARNPRSFEKPWKKPPPDRPQVVLLRSIEFRGGMKIESHTGARAAWLPWNRNRRPALRAKGGEHGDA